MQRSVTTYWLVVLIGATLTVAALPFAIRSVASAPTELWVLAGLSLVADIRPVPLPATTRSWATFVVSICFCFAILLLYGTPTAIVIQTLAVSVAAPRLRLNTAAAAFLAAQLACSLAAAGLTARLLHVTSADSSNPRTIASVGGLIAIIVVFVAVSSAINVTRALSSGATESEIVVQVRFEVLARGSVLVLGAVAGTAPSALSLSLLFVPLLGWSRLVTVLGDQDARLEHDPVTGLSTATGWTWPCSICRAARTRPRRVRGGRDPA